MTPPHQALAWAATAALLLNLVAIHSAYASNERGLLGIHNAYRAQHCTAPLSWSSNLAARSKAWAQTLASRCKFALSHSTVGENAWAGEGRKFSAREIVGAWYDEIKDYNHSTGRSRNGGVIGHYTQMMWKGSRTMGCGSARCGGITYVICQYRPAGNLIGTYTSNVKPRCK